MQVSHHTTASWFAFSGQSALLLNPARALPPMCVAKCMEIKWFCGMVSKIRLHRRVHLIISHLKRATAFIDCDLFLDLEINSFLCFSWVEVLFP